MTAQYIKIKCPTCNRTRRQYVSERRSCIICTTSFSTKNHRQITCGASSCVRKNAILCEERIRRKRQSKSKVAETLEQLHKKGQAF